LVNHMDQVLEFALSPAPPKKKRASRKKNEKPENSTEVEPAVNGKEKEKASS